MVFSYSPSENQFLMNSLKAVYESGKNWPKDAFSVSDEISMEFMGTPPEGMIRFAGEDGFPTWITLEAYIEKF